MKEPKMSPRMVEKLANLFRPLVGPVAFLGFVLFLLQQIEPLHSYRFVVQRLNFGLLGFFAIDVLLNWLNQKEGWRYWRLHGYKWIVMIPFLHFLLFPQDVRASILVQQSLLLVGLIIRLRRIHFFITWLGLKPAQLMLMSFLCVIGVGTVMLLHPASTAPGCHTDFVGALFTSTSATCVTGLTVYDTATHFTGFGQAIILLLIQIGGLGIMTFSMSFALLMRRSVSMKDQSIMQDVLDQDTLLSMRKLVGFIVVMTLFLEAVGAGLLFFGMRAQCETTGQAIWAALFHSVSAFCNAGFSTFSDNLIGFKYNLTVNAVIGVLIILGGIGFMVIGDFHRALVKKFVRRHEAKHKFRIQSRLAISWTAGLIILGTGLFYWIEQHRSLENLSYDHALLISLFQSISTRTAGFNSCDIGALQPATLFMMIVLMFIGAGPGGTAGGIKVTTPAVLWAVIRAGFNRRLDPELYRRTIPVDVVQKAVMVLCSSLLLVCGATIVLLMIEQKEFLDVLFETVSAFGTVGLSTGLTPELTAPGRLLISLIMFIGRLGPITIGFSFMLRYVRSAKYSYADERVMIG